MLHIVSYSGGIGSAYSAKLLCDKYGNDNVILLFADTLIEHPSLYEFNKQLVDKLNCHFISIQDGRTPWQVFEDVKYIGNTRIDPCSRVLKRDLIKKWLIKNFNQEEVIVYVGIDCSEEHRLINVVKNNLPYIYKSILIENNIFLDNNSKIQFCIDNNLVVPELYKLGLSHNNCGGFCVKAGLGQFKLLYELLPDTYKEHELEQERIMKNNPNLKPFLRKTLNKKITYLSLKEYREQYLEKSKVSQEDSLDFGGCGCAIE